MPKATNEQVQIYSQEYVRPTCERFKALQSSLAEAQGLFGDVYLNLTDNPDWTDQHTGNPPHLMVPNDILAWNTAVVGFQNIVSGPPSGVQDEVNASGLSAEAKNYINSLFALSAQWPIIGQCAVRWYGSE